MYFYLPSSYVYSLLFRESQSSAIKPEKQINIDAEVLELFIDLQCQFKPYDVCNFIKMNEGYRLEETLTVSFIPILSENL